tara:strand:+ start:236 stop:358 length:123 start_codon:yes stop_codon:yes gene_type:complete
MFTKMKSKKEMMGKKRKIYKRMMFTKSKHMFTRIKKRIWT